MEFKTVEEAKKYLENLQSVVFPQEYTYFIHCTTFSSKENAEKNNNNRSWTELPTKNFVVSKEMSFVERKDRVREALDYGGLDRARNIYTSMPDSKPFQIRVVIPRANLSEEEKTKLGFSNQDYRKFVFDNHLGKNGRHPKLWNGEKIEIFATSTYDEVTKTQQDIFYGVREQDIIKYAEMVSRELEKGVTIQEDKIPQTRDAYDDWKTRPFSLQKAPNNYRYFRKYIPDEKGSYQAYQYSEFEKEYYDDIKKSVSSPKAKPSTSPSSSIPDDDYDIGMGMAQEQTSSKKRKPYIKSTTIEEIQSRYNHSQRISSNSEKTISKNSSHQNYEQPQELSNNSQRKKHVLTDLYEQQKILEEFVKQQQELQEELENEEDYGISM